MKTDPKENPNANLQPIPLSPGDYANVGLEITSRYVSAAIEIVNEILAKAGRTSGLVSPFVNYQKLCTAVAERDPELNKHLSEPTLDVLVFGPFRKRGWAVERRLYKLPMGWTFRLQEDSLEFVSDLLGINNLD